LPVGDVLDWYTLASCSLGNKPCLLYLIHTSSMPSLRSQLSVPTARKLVHQKKARHCPKLFIALRRLVDTKCCLRETLLPVENLPRSHPLPVKHLWYVWSGKRYAIVIVHWITGYLSIHVFFCLQTKKYQNLSYHHHGHQDHPADRRPERTRY